MDSIKIGKRLAELRGNRSQETVAKCVGISISSLSMYESGLRNPRDEVKLRLAEYYRKSVQEIFFTQ